MLKAGIFLDMENLTRNGGWGMRLESLRDLVEAQGTTIVRANAYMAVDTQRERDDWEYRDKARSYRDRVRSAGFHIVDKEVRRYSNDDGSETVKANSDLDMAVDALLQSENLDYVLIGSGDGDFNRLVRALQDKGKRVDILGFKNVSNELKRHADHYFPGALFPNLLPVRVDDDDYPRYRGVLHSVVQDKGFGFVNIHTGFGRDDVEEGIFCHISQVMEDGMPITNDRFYDLSRMGAIIEFEKSESDKGVQAIEVEVY